MELYINSQGMQSLPNFLKITAKAPIPENRAKPTITNSFISFKQFFPKLSVSPHPESRKLAYPESRKLAYLQIKKDKDYK